MQGLVLVKVFEEDDESTEDVRVVFSSPTPAGVLLSLAHAVHAFAVSGGFDPKQVAADLSEVIAELSSDESNIETTEGGTVRAANLH